MGSSPTRGTVGPPRHGAAPAAGLHLGDGCTSAHARGVHALRVACCDDHPGLVDECEESMRAVHAGAVLRCAEPGRTSVETMWEHWPCVFPQHGPGRKHEQEIRPEQWTRPAERQVSVARRGSVAVLGQHVGPEH